MAPTGQLMKHFSCCINVTTMSDQWKVVFGFYICRVTWTCIWLCSSILLRCTTVHCLNTKQLKYSIKTHGRMSVAKKAVWRTSMLFIGTTNSPFSTPHISIITALISIKFTYFMPSIYTTLYTTFEENWPSSSRDMCSWKLSHFLLASPFLHLGCFWLD